MGVLNEFVFKRPGPTVARATATCVSLFPALTLEIIDLTLLLPDLIQHLLGTHLLLLLELTQTHPP